MSNKEEYEMDCLWLDLEPIIDRLKKVEECGSIVEMEKKLHDAFSDLEDLVKTR